MSLNVDNCNRCGKVYIKNTYGICGNCIKSIDLQYEKCLKYLREYRSCSINELSEATEVSVSQITKFIREGRISIKGNANMSYDCEVCGTQIREHTMCEPCRSRLAKETNQMREDETRKKIQEVQSNKATYNIRDRLNDRL
ncbi:flagellar protein [Paenibacillus radicis (ex Xue et al. 2023)]|uniref:Flagellar protein n=1 Tax=Paenibacillus radicis (ex Xue et al. 2023) TaxID=2972489 RepID=A0ABT1YGP1_9BACL|nr:flagellar protein [Paenibacillus radicis (ex Xue et al. 2023)]MCR8632363.1 flagellar protein [Paenibacillus radicis (ex Xue et al. 2023)]